MSAEPGPVVIGRASPDIEDVHLLRLCAADDGHVAWIDARPANGRDSLAPLSQDLLDAIGCCGNRAPRMVGERHLYRALPYLRHGDVTDVVVTEAQWLTVPTLRELLMAGAIAAVRLWLLVGEPVPEEHDLLFASVTGRVHPWPDIAAYWERRLRDAAARAVRCPAVRDDWWQRDRRGWPTGRADHGCPTHPTRVSCLLAAARRGLTAGTLDPERMRTRLQQVEADPATDAEEIWELRDAGRDTFTPAEDALSQLVSPDQRFVDVHAGMLSSDGSQLSLPDQQLPVPAHMRRTLLRQRTTSVLCNGPADWPLLTLFDEYRRI